jgi:hypothetical protein
VVWLTRARWQVGPGGGTLAAVVVGACGTGISSTSAPTAKGTVNVAYAGSSVNLLEHKLGPAFQTATRTATTPPGT